MLKAVESALTTHTKAVARVQQRQASARAAASSTMHGVMRYENKGRHTTLTIDDLDGIPYEYKPIPKHVYGMSDVIQPMSRRKFPASRQVDLATPPVPQGLSFEVSTLDVVLRCFVWLRGIIVFSLSVLGDKLLRRDTQERRAQRLLHMFQQTGGTIVKIGQQLAIRVDMLPYVYCKELSKLLDTVKPFPPEQAIETIERALGKRLNQVFQSFDAAPIGSASIACVYQAVLKDGTKVAVKVRRPNVGYMFAADVRAIKVFLSLMETLTFVRAGLLGNFVLDFENSIMEELDFRKEANYQELFRRHASKQRMKNKNCNFTAPRIFFSYSNAEVLVQEFCSGMWAWEILAAVEQNDRAALARMRQLNIDATTVAKGIIWASFWGAMSNYMFHADPHPANIVIKPNNEIVFIDFGACGTINSEKRVLYEEFFYHQMRRDVHGMVQCSLSLMEPLPHIDIHEIEKDLEMAIWESQCRMWSKHSKWYERTNAAAWLTIFSRTQKHSIPINLDTVRLFRANMLYDSLAIRLYNDLRVDDEYREFSKDMAAAKAKKFKRSLGKTLSRGPKDREIASAQEFMNTGGRAFFKLKRFINRRTINFSNLIEKPVVVVVVIAQTIFFVVGIFLVWASVVTALGLAKGDSINFFEAGRRVTASLRFQFLAVLIMLINVRRIMFRLYDREIKGREIS